MASRPKTMPKKTTPEASEEVVETGPSSPKAPPAGLAALRNKADQDRVRVVNVSLKEVTVHHSDEARLTSKDEAERKSAMPLRTVLKPFGSLAIWVKDAKRELLCHERPGGPMDLPLMVEAPEGNCRKNFDFVDRETGTSYESCPFVGCLTHPAPNEFVKPISIWQSQHRVSSLGTIPAIERWIQIDGRQPVMMWGHRVINRRRAQREDDLGISRGTRGRTATY